MPWALSKPTVRHFLFCNNFVVRSCDDYEVLIQLCAMDVDEVVFTLQY